MSHCDFCSHILLPLTFLKSMMMITFLSYVRVKVGKVGVRVFVLCCLVVINMVEHE